MLIVASRRAAQCGKGVVLIINNQKKNLLVLLTFSEISKRRDHLENSSGTYGKVDSITAQSQRNEIGHGLPERILQDADNEHGDCSAIDIQIFDAGTIRTGSSCR